MTSRSVIASFKPWAARTPRHIRDVTRPFRIYFRRNRMREFLRWMAVSDCMTIIDVGGTPFVWQLTNCDPSVTIVGPSMTNLWVWGTRGDLDIGARYNVVTGLTDVDDISSLAAWRQSAHALIGQPRSGLPGERLRTGAKI